MAKRVFLGGSLLVLALSCAETGPGVAGPDHPEGTVEDDRDYRDGLSETLEDPRSSMGSALLTEVYRLGFTAGRRERVDVTCREVDERRRAGCVGIAARIATVARATNAGTAPCDEMIRVECATAAPRGTRYAGGRRVADQKAREAGRSELATALGDAYERGYVRGYARVRRNRLPAALADVHAGCTELIAAENAREPFSPDDRAMLTDRCNTLASEFVQEHAHELVDPPRPR